MAESQAAPSFNPAELIRRVEDTEKRLQTKDAEIQVYKMLMSQMEEELAQAKKIKVMHEKQAQDVDSIKSDSEKTLTKAKSLLFERTKIIKNQELQIEAFVQQIESLKEVVRITKELLEIRNLEIKQLEIKISAIEGKTKAEHERYDLMHKKLEQMIRHNGELKREYETQLCLFSALRDRYNERELAKDVVDDLKEELKQANDNNKSVSNEDNKNEEQVVVVDDNDKINQVEETKSNVENTQNNVENALIDAKTRLDNTLSALENTLSINPTELKPSLNMEEDLTQEKNEPQTVESTDKKENTPNENSATENVVAESGTQPEASSTLGIIMSALKTTIGLSPPTDNETQIESKAIPENSTNASEIGEKK